jgi:hypothetical protein
MAVRRRLPGAAELERLQVASCLRESLLRIAGAAGQLRSPQVVRDLVVFDAEIAELRTMLGVAALRTPENDGRRWENRT